MIRWTGHEAHMRDVNCTQYFGRTLKGRDYYEDPSMNGIIILKCMVSNGKAICAHIILASKPVGNRKFGRPVRRLVDVDWIQLAYVSVQWFVVNTVIIIRVS